MTTTTTRITITARIIIIMITTTLFKEWEKRERETLLYLSTLYKYVHYICVAFISKLRSKHSIVNRKQVCVHCPQITNKLRLFSHSRQSVPIIIFPHISIFLSVFVFYWILKERPSSLAQVLISVSIMEPWQKANHF